MSRARFTLEEQRSENGPKLSASTSHYPRKVPKLDGNAAQSAGKTVNGMGQMPA
ncbi:hypothetical protein ART_1037 [Arthrobacter sp. PAMC 25486]|nr:hypothetical protein ART_1037 [Arthrobacter sp. PAMC 25486]